jgi:predicted transcriptional regulator
MPRMPKSLGQAELEILRIVQEQEPVTVGEIAQQVAADTGKARTTVATTIERLLQKGFVKRKKVEGKYRYSARLSKTELLRGLVQRFVDGTLGGSLSPFVAYLAENPDLTSDEIEQLQQLLRELEPRGKGRRS